MERIMYSAGLMGFCSKDDTLVFHHGEDEIRIAYDDVVCIELESDMSAKTGAYVRFCLETENATLKMDSEHAEFFDVLFEMISVELDVDLDEIFNIAAANTRTKKTVYQKKEEEA